MNEVQIDWIISVLTDLLRRVYTIEKVLNRIQKLKMSFIYICIESDDFEARFKGMKMLNKLLDKTMDLQTKSCYHTILD